MTRGNDNSSKGRPTRTAKRDQAKIECIPFIEATQDDAGNALYRVTDEAAEFWSSVPEDVSIVVVIGKYREGKSHLINTCFLDEEPCTDGFSVGHTVNSCTKGIWVYPKVIERGRGMSKRRLVVMDAEGIGSLDANKSHDVRIFSLALLLSSCFVYNSMKCIDEGAIETLSLVLNVSDVIRVNSSEEANSATEADLVEYMPRFHWVVRDFSLELEDAGGRTVTEDGYLESALADTRDAEKNRVRGAIRRCFPDRGCSTIANFVAPKVDPDKFEKQLSTLKRALIEKSPIKSMKGQPLSGRMITTMARSFCESINRGAAPVIGNSWQLMCEVKSRQGGEALVRDFTDITSKWTERTVPVEETRAALGRLLDEHMARFDQNCRMMRCEGESTTQREIRDSLLACLQRRSDEVIHIVRRNMDAALEAIVDRMRATLQATPKDRLTWQVVASCAAEAKSEACAVSAAGGASPSNTPSQATITPSFWMRFGEELLHWGGEMAQVQTTITVGEQRRLEAALQEASRDRDDARQAADAAASSLSRLQEEARKAADAHRIEMERTLEQHATNLQEAKTIKDEAHARNADQLQSWIEKCEAAEADASARQKVIARLERDVESLREQVAEERPGPQGEEALTATADYVRRIESLKCGNANLESKVSDLQVQLDDKEAEVSRAIASGETALEEVRAHAALRIREHEDAARERISELERQVEAGKASVEAERQGRSEDREAAERRSAENLRDSAILREKLSVQVQATETERQRCAELVIVRDRLSKQNTDIHSKRMVAESEHSAETAALRERMLVMEAENRREAVKRTTELNIAMEENKSNKRDLEHLQLKVGEVKRMKSEREGMSIELARLNTRVEEMDKVKQDSIQRERNMQKIINQQAECLHRERMRDTTEAYKSRLT